MVGGVRQIYLTGLVSAQFELFISPGKPVKRMIEQY